MELLFPYLSERTDLGEVGKDAAGKRQGSAREEAKGREGREKVTPAYFSQRLLRRV